MASLARLLPSLDLVHRVIDATTAYTIARMRVYERIPGNPVGIAYRTLDNAVALMAQHLPSPAFNSVVGLRRGQAEHIRPLIEWYRAHGVAGPFELTARDDHSPPRAVAALLWVIPSASYAALIGL